MISGQVVGDTEVVARLRRFAPNLREELRKAVTASAFNLQAHVVGQKLSGQVLKRKTGALAASIGFEVGEDAEGVQARVGTLKKAVVYARIHEYGGKTAAHVILPKHKKALAFGGRVVKRVNHPGSKITEKKFLRGSLDDKKAEFFARIDAAVRKATTA